MFVHWLASQITVSLTSAVEANLTTLLGGLDSQSLNLVLMHVLCILASLFL